MKIKHQIIEGVAYISLDIACIVLLIQLVEYNLKTYFSNYCQIRF